MIARAAAMRQLLKDDQVAAEERGFYSEEIHKAHGGSAGAAWCLDLGTHHSIILASHWPVHAQREIFGEHNGHFVCGHRAGMGGTARRVEGGYRVTGRWRYSSGIPYSTHHMVGARVESDEDLPQDAPACGEKYAERCATTGQPYSLEDDTRLHAALQQAGLLAWRAMESLWTAAPVDAVPADASSRARFLAPQLAAVHFGLTDTVLPAGPG
jgi:hypothetical protein